MGDVIWIEPLIEDLSKKYRKVYVYTKFPGLFQFLPFSNVKVISRLSIVGKIKWLIDRTFKTRLFVIDLENSYEKRPKMHLLQAYYEAAGMPFRRCLPNLYIPKSHISKNKPVAILHIKALSSVSNFRNIFGVDWSFISRHLASRGYSVVEVGDPPGLLSEHYKATSLAELMILIANADFFIGLDSGPSHIAAIEQVPSIIFFGAINPYFRHFPELTKVRFMQKSCEFAHCYHDNPRAYEKHICRVVGDQGIPPCCQFTTEEVVAEIDRTIKTNM